MQLFHFAVSVLESFSVVVLVAVLRSVVACGFYRSVSLSLLLLAPLLSFTAMVLKLELRTYVRRTNGMQ